MLSEDERRVLAMFWNPRRGRGPTTISPLPFLPCRPDRLARPAHPYVQGDQPGSGWASGAEPTHDQGECAVEGGIRGAGGGKW